MKPPLLSVLTPVLLLAWAGQSVLAADPDTASPLVSYQYLDSLAEPPDQVNVVSPLVSYQYIDSMAEPPGQPNIVSPLVSYQFFEWPNQENLTVHTSPVVSFEFEQVAIANVSWRASLTTPTSASFAFNFPTDSGNSYFVEFKNTLMEAVWRLVEIIGGNGRSKTIVAPVTKDMPSGFYRVRNSSGGFLSFPLAKSLGKTPYTASISAVMDHSQPTGCSNGVVVAFTGETGFAEFGHSVWSGDGESKTCLTDTLYGFRQDDAGTRFSVCGQYVDVGNKDQGKLFLFYDGHTGYDYPAANGTAVYAAAEGTAEWRNLGGGPNDVRIDHDNGYVTFYLHLMPSEVASIPRRVARDELIGRVGAGHLHLTVKKRGALGEQRVDPYGWKGTAGTDPWKVDGEDNACLWLECQDCP